jgi:hypothetical protein
MASWSVSDCQAKAGTYAEDAALSVSGSYSPRKPRRFMLPFIFHVNENYDSNS